MLKLDYFGEFKVVENIFRRNPFSVTELLAGLWISLIFFDNCLIVSFKNGLLLGKSIFNDSPEGLVG